MKLIDSLKGWKTYIIALGAIVTATGAYLNDSISLTQLVQAIFAALTTMSMRAAVAKGPSNPTSLTPTILVAAICLLSAGNLTYAGVDQPFAQTAPETKSIKQVEEQTAAGILAARQFEVFAYPEYGRGLQHKFGGSIDILYPIIGDNVFAGIELTQLDGGLFAAAIGLTLKTSFDFGPAQADGTRLFQATPFAEAAVETQFVGGASGDQKNLDPGALTAVGTYVRLWKNHSDSIELYALGVAKWYSQYNLMDGPPTTVGFGAGVRVKF